MGASLERRITKVTWSKDPASAPIPGAYAAVDLVSRFERASRHCGYIVVVQAPNGGPFKVSRIEEAYMDDASAREIQATRSAAALDDIWTRLSQNCPGYPRPPLPEAPDETFEYASPAAALADLRGQAGVSMTEENGWTIATDKASMTLWSFAPPAHPAYPSVVKRQVLAKSGVTSLEMKVLCQASKTACDDLVRSFNVLNAQMEKSLNARR